MKVSITGKGSAHRTEIDRPHLRSFISVMSHGTTQEASVPRVSGTPNGLPYGAWTAMIS